MPTAPRWTTIRDIWNSLTPDQRQKLADADPLTIGNLNGIPLSDRIAANKVNIRNEIARRQSEITALQKRIDGLSGGLDDGTNGMQIAALNSQIADHQKYIDSFQALLDKKWEWKDENRNPIAQTGVNVVVFDPKSSAIGSYYGPIDPQTGDTTWHRATTRPSFNGPAVSSRSRSPSDAGVVFGEARAFSRIVRRLRERADRRLDDGAGTQLRRCDGGTRRESRNAR